MFTKQLFFLAVSCIVYGAGAKAVKTLLVSHKNDILQLELENSSSSSKMTMVSADLPIVAFDVHQSWQQMFWATDNCIYRTPLYDLQTTTQIAATGEVGALAVDWVHHQVYWSDLTTGRIEAAHLDGRGRRIVHDSDWSVRALVVDPQVGKLIWLEFSQAGSSTARVKTSSLFGSNIKLLHSDTNIYELSPLAIDVIYKSVYFYKINGTFNEHWQVNYAGIKPAVRLFEREEPAPRSLDLTGKGFYYSNSDGLSLGTWVTSSYVLVDGNKTYRVSVLNPYFSTVDKDLTEVNQIRVMEGTQPHWQDHCKFHSCQHECAPSGVDDTTCACGYGYSLMSDNKSCSENGYLLYTTGNMFGRATLDGDEVTILYNDSFSNIQAFDVHIQSGFVYWSDLVNNVIYRAPAESPTRKQEIVTEVSAYGVAVDWLHGHLYWSDHSRIVVSGLDGSNPMAVLEDVDAPADMVVDPIHRYIFWAECGYSLSLRRAGLSGDNMTVLVSHVTCGVSLVADPNGGNLYWLNWSGDVFFCDYDCTEVKRLHTGLARAIAVFGQGLVWISWDHEAIRATANGDPLYHVHVDLPLHGVKLTSDELKVMSSSRQPEAPNICEDSDCPGLCIPSSDPTVPLCVCADGNEKAVPCFDILANSMIITTEDLPHMEKKQQKPYLEVVDTTPFSITLQCVGILRTHPNLKVLVQVIEVDSLVPRYSVPKMVDTVRVVGNHLPFTIDSLNPATSYNLTVPNRVTRAAFTMTVHTSPPPLAVKRRPVVTVPGVASPLKWLGQGVHFSTPNPWEDLVTREYLLLLISRKEYFQSTTIPVQEPVMQKLMKEIKGKFTVLHHYKSDDQFDDDPEMYLGNIPWGEDFWLAMVQVTQYHDVYNLDSVFTVGFSLPDPYWNYLMEEIFEDLS